MRFNLKSQLQKINRNLFNAWLLGIVLVVVVVLNLGSVFFYQKDNTMQSVRFVNSKAIDEKQKENSKLSSATNFVECKEFDIRLLLRNYYDVLSSGNRTELSKYVDDVSGYSDDFLQQNIDYVEQYMDIQCYYMEGMMPGTYLVAAYCYAKFYGIGTAVPVIDEFYVCSNAHGRYYICTKDVGEEIETYNRYMFDNSQIVEMHRMYETERDSAMDYDPQIEALLRKIDF